MSGQNPDLLEAVNKIKNKFISDLQAYKHNAMRSSPCFVNYYMDWSVCYENGVKICENFCWEQNILELVKELIIFGLDKEVSMLKQHINDFEGLNLILEAEILQEIKDELLATLEDIKKHMFE